MIEQDVAAWRQVEDRAIGWISRSLDCFDPFTYPAVDRRGRLAARKALVELAALLLQQRQMGSRSDDKRYIAMVDRLATVSARRAYRDLVARQHRTLWLYGIPYAALRAWGRDDRELRTMLEQAVAVRYPVTWERLPFRYLDYLHFLDAGGLAHSVLPAGQVFPLTLLSSAPNVAELEEDDLYAITHAVFYMTAYGAGESHWPVEFDQRDAAELIETLLWECVIAEHADLTAELLICAACLGGAASGAAIAGWDLLQRLQLPSGAIPAPDHLIPRAYRGERDDPAYLEWRRCYHTTVMSAMACISHAHDARQPAMPEAGIGTVVGEPALPDDGSAGVSASRLTSALHSALAWLRESAGGGSAFATLVAQAGAAAPRLGQPDTDALTLRAARAAAVAAVDAHLSVAEIVACAELLGLVAATLRRGGAESEAVDALFAVVSTEADSTGPDVSLPLDGRAALSLARTAVNGELDSTTRAQWGVHAVRAFRDYRLGDAAIIVSAIALGGGEQDRAVRDVVGALLAQQRIDGSFGYAATDVEDDTVAALRRLWTARIVWALTGLVQPSAVRPMWVDALLPSGGLKAR